MNRSLLPAALLAALAVPAAAQTAAPAAASSSPSGAELQALRDEIQALRSAYEARLQALEQRLQAAEGPARPAAGLAAAPATAPAPAGTGPAAAAAAPAAAAPGANAFNPAISLILSGQYTRTSREYTDDNPYRLAGFARTGDAEIGPGSRGLGLGESELRFAASIDPWLRGAATFAIHDDEFGVEEAFIETTSLGRGLTLKAGRFFSNVGYLNPQHAHAWDFVDNPLAYQALLGTQLGDDGLQLRWIAPTDQLIELSAEVMRGAGFPGSDSGGNGTGLRTFSVHTGGDVGDSHSWRAGVSVLQARARGQELLGLAANDTATFFDGRTRVWIADAVWKWAPGGNATRTNFKLQGEYLQARRSGALAASENEAGADFRGTQSGWYVQGVWQFMPRWRVGARTERLDAGTPGGAGAALVAGSGFKPSRHALLLEFDPSEFSRVRLQLAQDRSREGSADRQIFLQYQMSLGAHGAHGY